MSNPTPEQELAIHTRGKNIIVSAGAGSGKTFVLKERVLEEVKNETSINNLIILTFTKNAAIEMKDRIRKILSKNNIKDAEYVDSAYITTFDSFAGSIVRKYNYLLNISKDFSIIDSNIVEVEIRNQLDLILEKKYKEKESKFVNFINNLCYKDDKSLRKDIINIYKSLSNLLDKNGFLNNYINIYFDNKFIDNKIKEYEENIINELYNYIELLNSANNYALKDEVIEYNNNIIDTISNINDLDELIDNFDNLTIKANSGGKVYSEEYKDISKQITDFKKNFSKYLVYYKKDLKEQYLLTKDNVSELIDILKELDNNINLFKQQHNSYEFSDIAFKAIKLVKNNEEVRNEIKNNTYEIMIDEYQDTNDIQEEFISYIENNNVYMVGDIKQSIYGFRNANPKLFKQKYDSYSKEDGGYKIDLTSNFRSREEVINNINDIFSNIMFDDIGGANYKETHKMKFGKKNYNELKDNIDYNLSLYNYKYEKGLYTKDEIEAFIIAYDIKEKMKSKIHTVHEVDGTDKLVDISYKDFCILVDKSNNFELLKSILEYNGIPCTIDKDLSIKKDDEVFILKNLITCLIHIVNKNYDEKFKHSFVSIARSYICNISDNDIYDYIKNNKYKDILVFNKLLNISKDINALSNKEILYKLIDEFDIVNKTIYVGNINNRLAKLEYFINECDSLNKFGMDIYTMEEFFDSILNSDDDIKMGHEVINSDCVKIMTIHGSKGLEYNYVYMPYLYSEFRFKLKGDILFNNDLGFILPFYSDGLDKTFMYNLNYQNNIKDIISEKIRLFYVAITRAKENFIMISEFNDKLYSNDINSNDLLKCRSFKDILSLLKNYLLKYTKYIDINSLNMNKDYMSIKDSNYENIIENSNEIININDININNNVIDNKHFSKCLNKVMDKELRYLLDFGTKMHYCFEIYDFNNNNLDKLNIKDEYKEKITNFLKHDEVKNISKAKVYKEHEIKFDKNGLSYHGFIDLLVEYSDHFDIIDYKLSNIDSEEYILQLNGYKEYIESKYNKKVNIYLYSIIKDVFKRV